MSSALILGVGPFIGYAFGFLSASLLCARIRGRDYTKGYECGYKLGRDVSAKAVQP
jgi:hypothetical protein